MWFSLVAYNSITREDDMFFWVYYKTTTSFFFFLIKVLIGEPLRLVGEKKERKRHFLVE